MKPKYIVYDFENEFNIELFLKIAKQEGFNLEGKLVFSPHPNLPKKNCICPTKGNNNAQGYLYDNELYVRPGEFGAGLRDVADNF